MNWQLIMVSGIALIVGALATFRITVLIVDDDITQRLRNLAGRWAFTDKLVSCIACCSVWVGIMVTGGYLLWPTVAFWVVLPFALSGVTLILDSRR